MNLERQKSMIEEKWGGRGGFRSNEKESELKSAIGKTMGRKNGKHLRSEKNIIGLH